MSKGMVKDSVKQGIKGPMTDSVKRDIKAENSRRRDLFIASLVNKKDGFLRCPGCGCILGTQTEGGGWTFRYVRTGNTKAGLLKEVQCAVNSKDIACHWKWRFVYPVKSLLTLHDRPWFTTRFKLLTAIVSLEKSTGRASFTAREIGQQSGLPGSTVSNGLSRSYNSYCVGRSEVKVPQIPQGMAFTWGMAERGRAWLIWADEMGGESYFESKFQAAKGGRK